jgi:prophage maintenance system killer protein
MAAQLGSGMPICWHRPSALVVAMLFLRLNGFAVTASQEDTYKAFIALAAGRLDEAALAAWLKEHCQLI